MTDNGHYREDTTPRVAGVLLAAGAGTRYGMPKVLAEEGTWVRNGINALSRGGCDVVFVVLGAAIVDLPAPARAVRNPSWAEGMGSSLRAGLQAAEQAGSCYVVLHLVDLPDVGSDVVRRVLDAATAPGSSGLARATYDGRPGHPVVVASQHWPELAAASIADQGGRVFLSSSQCLIKVACGDLATGADWDHPWGSTVN